jgi:hypothetical protein
MTTMVYAVESWILALISWAWLSFQEIWAWSLLSAHVFYGLMWLSTCNVIASGIAPESAGPRSAYFASVLAFFLYSSCCILDTLPMPVVGPVGFESPINRTTCTLPRSNQIYFFSDSQFYLAQAGATLAYLVIQLVVSGAALLDSDLRTLWPGPAWGAGVGVLLCGRFVSTFDGMASVISAQSSGGRYLSIFAIPVAEFAFLFYGFMYLLGILVGIDGLLFPGLAWRRSVRYVTFTSVLLFVSFTGWTLIYKGIMTPSMLALLILILVPAVVGMVEAVQAKELPPAIAPQQAPIPGRQFPYPGSMYQSPVPNLPVFQVPPQPWPSAPPYPTGRAPAAGTRQLRHAIPSPVEMLGVKNKGV